MASTGFFNLVRFTALAAGDVLAAVDISDTTQSAHGSLDSITVANFFGGIPVPTVITGGVPGTTAALRVGATAAPVVRSPWNTITFTPANNSNVAGSAALDIYSYGQVTELAAFTSGGTVTIPTASSASVDLFKITGGGYDTSTWATSASIIFQATQTWTATKHGTQIQFNVIPNDDVSPGTAALVLGQDRSAAFAAHVSFVSAISSTTTLGTPTSAGATQFIGFANATNGGCIMGYGATYDVALINSAGNVALGVTHNSTAVVLAGTLNGITINSATQAVTGISSLTIAGALAGVTTIVASGNTTYAGSAATLFNFLGVQGTTTAGAYMRLSNTTADGFFGIESSTGGSLLTGSTAYAVVISNAGNVPVQIGAHDTLVASFTTGGVVIPAAMAAASLGSGSDIALGGSTQTTIGANGAASALTANPLGYLIAYKGATKIIIPYYNG